MSQHFNPGNSQMSKFAIPNVDIPKLTDSEQQFQYLLSIVQDLQQRVTSHDDVIAELTTLRNENAKLKAEITNLRAQLESTTSSTTTKNDSDSSSVFPPLVNTTKQASAAPVSSYSAVAARSASKPVTKKRKLAAGRTFMPIDPSAPRGFEYLYLNRKRKLSRAEVRRNLRLLGFDLSRVLDICFPGPKVIGLLVHVQYKEEVISLLSAAKVPLVDGFDPLDPVNLADPELQHLSLADKANECAELQFTRCSRALSRLGAGRAHLVGPIGKYFSSKGWIDEDSLSQILSSLPSPLSASRGRDPGAAFRGDTVMSDALVSDSASAGSHSL
jgi:regulator of replication initiation timing